MRPHNDYRNGDGGNGGGGGSSGGGGSAEDSEGEEAPSALEAELSLEDAEAPARALAALNALRKSRQYCDVVLVAGGEEVPAHRAVLAAASPYLLRELGALPPPAGDAAAAPPAYRVEGVRADALRELVEYAYTGRLAVREAEAARRLYRAAWRLRVEPVRAHLAARLLRRLEPAHCLAARALPDLAPHHRALLDAYIADNFDDICACGALATLPLIRIEMLRESSAEGGEETLGAVAEAALAWLRDQPELDMDDLCARTHLLYVDGSGALRDCGELPAARDDTAALREYRREAAEREKERGTRRRDATSSPDSPGGGRELGVRAPRGDCAVLAWRELEAGGVRGVRGVLAVRGRLAAARVAWREVGAGGAGVARGGPLGGAAPAPEPAGGTRRASLSVPRCAHGVAALGDRLVVCGGYDRARVLRCAEAYSPATNTWTALPSLRGARARFPAAKVGRIVLALGGSDGHAELDSVDAYEEDDNGVGAWRARARLPLARSYAAAATDESRGEVYVVGGWANGLSLRQVHKYSPQTDAWTEAPRLATGRSQCAVVVWEGVAWALGGCDAWHCLASTERLQLARADPAWTPGPPLPTARRSMGGCVWRGRLVSAGGSDGAASLRRVDWLPAPSSATERVDSPGAEWRAGPPLRRARAGLGLAVLQDALYAVGGFDGKEFLSCVECLYEPAGEWTTLTHAPGPRPPVPALGVTAHAHVDADFVLQHPHKAKPILEETPKEQKENGIH